MDVMLLLIQQNLVMFVYLIIGYLLIKNGIMTDAGSSEVGKMLLYLVMPVAIIRSFIREFSTEMLTSFLVSFLAALAALVLAVVVSLLIFHKRSGVRVFGAAFSNAGFIGIPLTTDGSGRRGCALCGILCGGPQLSTMDLRYLGHDG